MSVLSSYADASKAGYSQRVSSVELVEQEGGGRVGFARMVMGSGGGRGTGIDVSRRPIAMDASDFFDDEEEGVVNE